MSRGSAPAPTSTTRPTTSEPCMRGNDSPVRLQPTSRTSALSYPESSVAVVTERLYQPTRVFMSELLRPQAATRTTTSPGPARGTGTSSRTCSISGPPMPKSNSALIVSVPAPLSSGRRPGIDPVTSVIRTVDCGEWPGSFVAVYALQGLAVPGKATPSPEPSPDVSGACLDPESERGIRLSNRAKLEGAGQWPRHSWGER